jgi:hypothetical protein
MMMGVLGQADRFLGTTVGIFVTANGGEGSTPATFTRWVYEGQGQKIDFNETVYPAGYNARR